MARRPGVLMRPDAKQQSQQQHDPRETTFGALLRSYRESYLERIGVKARMPLSAKALVQCMGESGYSIGPGFFSEIEHGAAYPADGGTFINTITDCLELQPVLRWRLIMQFNYDLVRRSLGDKMAAEIYEREPKIFTELAGQPDSASQPNGASSDQAD